jgi:translation initiation factor 1
MPARDNARIVYSTGRGAVCPACGWPAGTCGCAKRTTNEPVPARVVAKLRMERSGRGGKTVTVVDGLPQNAAFLKDLCADLKRACGTGGAIRDGAIELQGDLRDRLRRRLGEKGFTVKG